MEMPSWVDGLVGSVRCASCGRLYHREDLKLVGERDEHWFVRCTCGSCGSQGIAVVIVQTVTVPNVSGGRGPITEDEVLSAHDALRNYTGNVDGLFGAGSSKPR